jgi:hypothetical protein
MFFFGKYFEYLLPRCEELLILLLQHFHDFVSLIADVLLQHFNPCEIILEYALNSVLSAQRGFLNKLHAFRLLLLVADCIESGKLNGFEQ